MPREARERQTILTRDGCYVTKTLPQICMDVHMYSTGSGPDLGEERYEDYKKTLQIAVDNWKEESPYDKLFDDAVLNLIKATLKECEGEK